MANSPPEFETIGPRIVSSRPTTKKPEYFGGDERDRTVGLLSAIQALSQLSYIPITPVFWVERGDILRSEARFATAGFLAGYSGVTQALRVAGRSGGATETRGSVAPDASTSTDEASRN